MKIRLLRLAAAASVAVGMAWAGVAEAQDKRVRANFAGAFPSSMGILGPAQARVISMAKEMSGGSIDLRFYEPGALVPVSQFFDAVSAGTLDMAYTASGYYTGKDPSLAIFTTVPFGPDSGEFLAWFDHGGGNELMREILGKYNIVPINCGLISPEASGWFRKEITSVEDLKGLKMRFFGLGSNVMNKLGVNTQLLAAGEIFQALQLGTIDATEFSMPTMDLSLGFYQVAKFYYFPGWHQQTSIGQLYITKAKWEEFSGTQKAILINSCKANMLDEFSEGEAKQYGAMQELVSKGVQIKKWSPMFLRTFENAWNEVVKEESAKSENFAKVWASYAKFRANYAIWREHGYMSNFAR